MTDDFNLEALRYLQDELDPSARTTFEATLDRDPDARKALKNCADAMAHFVGETTLAEAMPPATQRAVLSAVLTHATAEPRNPQRNFEWKRFAWPLAAAALLVLNLAQYFHPFTTDFSSSTRGGKPGSNTASSAHDRASAAAHKTAQNQPLGATEPDAQTVQAANSPNAGVTEELHRLEKLRADYATLERKRAALSSEYNGLIRQLATHALVNKGVGRLAAMELVDADAYARGERKGLVDIARGLLTEPGIVTIGPETPPTNPPAPQNPSPEPTNPSPDPMANRLPDGTTPAPVTPPPTTPAETPQTSNSPDKSAPYAWSVFDEASSRGYLNLYNLPATPADQSLQLWVKPANSDTYQRVGEVPTQFYGSSGSLYYNLPGEIQPPTDILITQEPRNASPAQPTGPVVLHGP